MEEKRRLEQELEVLTSLKQLVQAHEEISTIRIRLARGSVLATRDFLESLALVLANVKHAYKKHKLEGLAKNHAANPEVSASQKKAFIFLSSNAKMYGSIINRTFVLFKEQCKKSDADIIIVGKFGRELYEASDIRRPYKYFEIADTEKGVDDLKPLFNHILPYDSITIFYGKLLNVVTQEPTSTNITGEETYEEEVNPQSNKYPNFIFEPSLDKLMSFFESQTFFSLFKQAVHEAELARYGSRIKAMEEAYGSINDEIKTLSAAERRVKNLLANKKQQDRISGMALWK